MRALGNPDEGHEENETLSGVTFNRGRFNIDSTITLYWDTLNRISTDSNDAVIASAQRELSAAQNVTNKGYSSSSWNAFTKAKNAVSTLLAQGGENKNKLQTAINTLKKAKANLPSVTAGGVTYKVSGSSAVAASTSKQLKKASVPATVKIARKTYKVTGINAKAFKGQKKLTTVTIGKNVKTIGSKAFSGTYRKITFKAPKSKVKAYQKLIKKAGASKKAKVKVA